MNALNDIITSAKSRIRAARCIIANFRTLAKRQGQWRTAVRGECIDASSEPIPWYTYPAIEFLRQLDFSDKRVFEYGCGNSTLFWSARARAVVSIEDSDDWFAKMSKLVPANVDLHLCQEPRSYAAMIRSLHPPFDIVVIDGENLKGRLECAEIAREQLSDDGMIVLDNSDWLPTTSEYLRGTGLIQVDMHGFGPINCFTWTTSLFLTRSVELKPRNRRQPMPPVGGVDTNKEES